MRMAVRGAAAAALALEEKALKAAIATKLAPGRLVLVPNWRYTRSTTGQATAKKALAVVLSQWTLPDTQQTKYLCVEVTWQEWRVSPVPHNPTNE